MFERNADGTFTVVSTALEHGNSLTFIELSELSEQIREVVSDEESRILQEELSGSLVCDGCTI
ncbi:hypothetical protein TacPo2_43 [Pantoea bacteriophage TacPo2]